ncbi:hypothetical protein AAEU29_08060 [Pseudoalteromonas sp. SSM20]|uniref:hypothetical protein n=1 Tax=Pseudoalteromonas sp. SSM20 TaxID=3139394 RepID=UPI003BA94EA5
MSFELISLLIFIFFLAFIFFSFSKCSGWLKLSKKYEDRSEFDGVIIKNISAKFVKNIYFNGILNIGVNDKFLHLSINPFFKLFTPSLLVPLDDLSFSFEKRNAIFKFKIKFKESPDIFFCITKRNAEKLGLEI